jgi:hypothetical protein
VKSRGAKFGALRTVIVSERRSREPNDPEWRSLPILICQLPIANCLFSKIFHRSHPEALPEYSGIH